MVAGCPACGDPLITDRERWCVHSVGWWWRENEVAGLRVTAWRQLEAAVLLSAWPYQWAVLRSNTRYICGRRILSSSYTLRASAAPSSRRVS